MEIDGAVTDADGHGRLELTKFNRPMAASAEPRDAPASAYVA
jgi:hypothetical protein